MKANHKSHKLPVKINTAYSGLFVFGLITALTIVTISINKSEFNGEIQSGFNNKISGNISGEIKDGEYQALGNYTSPGGRESINVKVVIENGKIQEASVEPQAKRAVSKRYQNKFTTNYRALVVGKNISTLQLDKVAGSSLTPKGFNDAVSKIITKSKS